MPCSRLVAVAAAAVLGSAAAVAAAAQDAPERASGSPGSARLLDVPYLPQSQDLCGGAAVAMVLRYWGERQVYAEDFATLVDRSASGIRTDVLAAAVSRRGWVSRPFTPGADRGGEWVRQQIDRGRPVIALIEVRPGRYHYVVVVAWTGEQVILHDPARTPFRVTSRPDFDRAWALAGRWALLVLPDERSESEATSTAAPPATLAAGGTCGALVQEMVQLAHAGELESAETGLLAATRLCPRDPVAWRELAGVRFRQSRWAEASATAERAALLEPGDEHGWDLLATSRFLDDQPGAALEAWNRIGRPSVDLVRVEGAPRTRIPVITALVALPPRALLTPDALGRAARRLDELPSAARTRLRYRPAEGGLAEIEAVVVERPAVPRGVAAMAGAAARAGLSREIRLGVAAPSGNGELWTIAWRWWEARPRLSFALAVPAVSGLPGVTTIEAFWERPSYATPGAEPSDTAAIHREERRRAALTVTDWASSRLRWQAGAAFDRWAEDSHVSANAALDLRFAGDRLAIGLDTAAWVPLGSGGRFTRSGVSAAWRSTRDRGRSSWLMTAGFTSTSAAAPFDLWAGAGTGHARTPLLRAHPLLEHGVVTGPTFGRRLAHGTIEYQHPLPAVPGGAIRLAAFADTARAWRRMDDRDAPRWQTDVGTGIRVALPGKGGTMRADVARGLRDGRVALSAGWQAPWPGR